MLKRLLATQLRRLADRLAPARKRKIRYPRRAPEVFIKAKWTGKGSLTEEKILNLLKQGPLTRREISCAIDTSTAGIILPRMVERGLIRTIPNQCPFIYELVTDREQTG